jgi:predicted amidophosphoribosyltransferase
MKRIYTEVETYRGISPGNICPKCGEFMDDAERCPKCGWRVDVYGMFCGTCKPLKTRGMIDGPHRRPETT